MAENVARFQWFDIGGNGGFGIELWWFGDSVMVVLGVGYGGLIILDRL